MYLLILEAFTYNYCIVTLFTSHYVSINSIMKCNVLLILKHLHPTMYLLIQGGILKVTRELLHLHPTMYLLILINYTAKISGHTFTSHYVSINSRLHLHIRLQLTSFTSHYVSINSSCERVS